MRINEANFFLNIVKVFYYYRKDIPVFEDFSALLIPTDLGHTCADSNIFCSINCVDPSMTRLAQQAFSKSMSDVNESENNTDPKQIFPQKIMQGSIMVTETIASQKMQTSQNKGTLKVKTDCTECQNEKSEYMIEGCRCLKLTHYD